MKYSVNPSVLGAMLALPAVVAEEHLKLASGDQLKALLAFFKFAGTDDYIENISKVTGLRAADVCDCLDYWVSSGVLLSDRKEFSADLADNRAEKCKTAEKPLVSGKPTRAEAIRRAAGDDELKFLFGEVQKKLSREITTAQMTTLVWLHDTYGLPASVILMAVEYARSENKTNFSYIEKVCVDWAENDVTDVVSAEKRINELYLAKSAWKFVSSAFGIADRRPSARESKYSQKWVNEYGFTKTMLKMAYDKCIDATQKCSFPYIGKILDGWYKNGIKKPEDIEQNNGENSSYKASKDSSYDINKMNDSFNNFDDVGW